MVNLDDEHVQRVVTYNYTDDEPMRNYFKCVFDNTGLWNPFKNTFNVDVAVENYKFDLDIAEVKQIFDTCLNYKTVNLLEWIVPFHKCLAASKVGEKAKLASAAAKDLEAY